MKRWDEIEQLFFDALSLSRDQRDAWLESHAGELAGQVKSLLDAHEASESACAFRRIGPYRLDRLISRGGMGEVWLAVRDDGQFEQRVAVKLVRSGLGADVLLPRFQRERQLLARLQHPNIAALLDGGIAPDGRPYLLMEYVEGEPLLDFCLNRRLDLKARLTLFCQLCSAVECAHRNLIVHRDIKPANVLVTLDGVPKLLDFGIAKLLEEDAGPVATIAMLTPRYASPEQLRGGPVSTATDVYSLGVLLFELLTASLPYRIQGSSAAEVITAVQEQEPLQASRVKTEGVGPVPAGDLDAILAKALEKTPERRYGSVESFSADIRNYLAGRPVNAHPLTAAYLLRKYVRRHVVSVTAATLVLLSITAAAAFSIRSARLAERQRVRAERIARFLEEVFHEADPAVRRSGMESGAHLTMLEGMRAAAARMPTAFRDDPGIQAELHRVFGDVYTDLGMGADAEREIHAALPFISLLDQAEKAALLHSAGLLDYRAHRLDQAESELREAVKLFAGTEIARREPNLYAVGLNNLAMLLSDRQKYAEAEQTLRRALSILKNWPPAPPGDLAVVEANVGLFDLGDGHLDRAREEVASAIDLFRRVPDPPIQLAMAEVNMGLIDRLLGRGREAQTDFEQAREAVLRTAEPNYAGLLTIRIELAYQRGLNGEAAAVEPELRVCLEESARPPFSERTRALLALGHVLTLAGKAEEAEPLLRECLNIRQRGGRRDYRIALDELALAECLERLERREEARRMYQTSLQDFRDHVGAAVWATQQAEAGLARLSAPIPPGK